MQNLFRRTSFLFWRYPILWLPIAIVDPIAFYLNLLDDKFTRAIVFRLVTRQPILGNTPEIDSSSLATVKWLVLTKPIDWATHLVALCLYVSAMVTIFTLISALRYRQKLSLDSILIALKHSFRRLVFFSLKLWIAIGIGTIALIVAGTFFVESTQRYISIQQFGLAVTAFGLSAVAYLLAPTAVQLLRSQDSMAINRQTARHAGIFAIVAAIACELLYFFSTQCKHSFVFSSAGWSVAYDIAASLVSATPYTVLFTALSLLALEDEADSELLSPAAEVI